MHPTTVSRVQQSWALVQPIAPQAAALFYQNLFSADPSLKPLFKGDMHEQGKKLMQMIGAAVGNNVAGGSRRVTSYEDREVCTTRYRTEYQRELVGYDVTYRYDGRVYTTNTRHHPGDRIVHVRDRY